MPKSASKMISQIFFETKDMSDTEYCKFLEEISSALEDAVDVKRAEMANQEG